VHQPSTIIRVCATGVVAVCSVCGNGKMVCSSVEAEVCVARYVSWCRCVAGRCVCVCSMCGIACVKFRQVVAVMR